MANTSNSFQPKKDVEDYLNNEFNANIYRQLTTYLTRTFEPLEFFNLFYQQVHFIEQYKNKPRTVKEHLSGLKLEEKEGYLDPARQHYYLICQLYNYYQDCQDEQLTICCGFIKDLQDEIKGKLPELGPSTKKAESPDFKLDKEAADRIENKQKRLLFLKRRKKEYEQYRAVEMFDPIEGDKSKLYQLEIDYVQDLIKNQPIGPHDTITARQKKPLFKLSDKRGDKIDLIRVLYALNELCLVEKANGQLPTKGEFMEACGEFFGTDLSEYDKDLSQALNVSSKEANEKVFERMKEVMNKGHYTSKN